jgi:hypothetical protein
VRGCGSTSTSSVIVNYNTASPVKPFFGIFAVTCPLPVSMCGGLEQLLSYKRKANGSTVRTSWSQSVQEMVLNGDNLGNIFDESPAASSVTLKRFEALQKLRRRGTSHPTKAINPFPESGLLLV